MERLDLAKKEFDGITPSNSITGGCFKDGTVMCTFIFDKEYKVTYHNANYINVIIDENNKVECFGKGVYQKNKPCSFETRLKINFRAKQCKSFIDALNYTKEKVKVINSYYTEPNNA